MKKLFVAACLFLCIRVYAQNAAQDSAFITYKDSINGVSFKYPAQWDSAEFNQLVKRGTSEFNGYFGAFINSGFSKNEFSTFFTFRDTTISKSTSNEMILKNSKTSFRDSFPNAEILDSGIKLSKNDLKYIFMLVELPQNATTTPIVMNIQFIRGTHKDEFYFTCGTDEDYQNLKNYFQEVIDSFQFDK